MKTAENELRTPLRSFAKVIEILENYKYDSEKLIPILQAVQKEYRYLPEPVMAYIANALDISPAKLYGVATFYAHFALKPKGKYLVRVCDGTACHVRGSMSLYDELRSILKLEGANNTTGDLLFTLETVSCLGACGLAPVMTVNDSVYGQLTPQKAAEIINEIRADEKGGADEGNS